MCNQHRGLNLVDAPSFHQGKGFSNAGGVSSSESQNKETAEGNGFQDGGGRRKGISYKRESITTRSSNDSCVKDAEEAFAHDEPPDHIAREFDFLASCADRELSGDSEAERWMGFRHRIGTEHLSAWVTPWSIRVEGSATTSFYRSLASLTRSIVESKILWSHTRASLLGRHLPLFSR